MRNHVKKLNRLSAIAIALCVGTIVSGCTPASTPKSTETAEKLDITVSILPQKYFVERIGGENVNVNVMVAPGASPHSYEPKPQQLRSLSEAEAYISIGVPFEKAWMDRIQAANPKMPIVDSTQGIDLLPMVAHHHHGEGDEEHHEDSGENLDPHFWLSPKRVKVHAQTIYQTLVELDPENQSEYQAALEQFLTDIDRLDAEIRQNLAGINQRKFMVFHPAWGYFADDYGLEMIAIEVGGQEPSAAELAALISEAKEEGIKVIFAQPEFNSQNAQTIAQALDGEVILISALMSNWLEEMQRISQTFAQVLRDIS